MTILASGGAGFIGGNFLLDWLERHDETVVNLDKLTYVGNLHTLKRSKGDDRHVFVHGDISDRELVSDWLSLLKRARSAISQLKATSIALSTAQEISSR